MFEMCSSVYVGNIHLLPGYAATFATTFAPVAAILLGFGKCLDDFEQWESKESNTVVSAEIGQMAEEEISQNGRKWDYTKVNVLLCPDGGARHMVGPECEIWLLGSISINVADCEKINQEEHGNPEKVVE